MAHPVPRFYLYLAAAPVTIRQLIQRARARYRWDTRPTTKRLRDEVAWTPGFAAFEPCRRCLSRH